MQREGGPNPGVAVALWVARGETPRDGILPIDPHLATRNQTTDFGELAQLGERLVCNQEVTGSSPVFSTSLALKLHQMKFRYGRT